jgi:hypothetical protein
LTRAVELRKVDALPCAKREPPFFDGKGCRLANNRRFDVRGRVALRVAVIGVVLGDDAVEPGQHVARDVGIGVLVDDDAGGRVGNVDMADTVARTEAVQGVVDSAGDVDELCAAFGGYLNALDHSFMRQIIAESA